MENKQNDVLIKLRRKYSKDEVVSALFKRLSDKDLEIGKLLSEIDFLNSELKKQKDEVEKLAIKRIQEHPIWIEQKKLIKKRGEEKENLRKKNSELSRQIYNLTKKLQDWHELLKDTEDWNVYHSPALPSGTMGTIKIQKLDGESL